jgi:serine/threonine-protein kinase
MELLEGENLFDFLENQNPLDLKTALAMMSQMAGALREIHKRGIIHRDLKPENIMVTRTGDNPPHIKILDFGLARAQNLTRLTRTGTIMGTIFYIAPEQLSGAKVLPAGDIYSMGVIYYLVLTGKKPFSGDTAFKLARRILKTEPPGLETIRPDLPAELIDLVKQMMAKKPDHRPSAAEVMDKLMAINH